MVPRAANPPRAKPETFSVGCFLNREVSRCSEGCWGVFAKRRPFSGNMFPEYFILGVWYVTLGTWLGQQLHFSGQEIGLAAGTTALGAMLSPFLVGLMADELFANQRLLAALHGVGG